MASDTTRAIERDDLRMTGPQAARMPAYRRGSGGIVAATSSVSALSLRETPNQRAAGAAAAAKARDSGDRRLTALRR
jgi:hypothetical protein